MYGQYNTKSPLDSAHFNAGLSGDLRPMSFETAPWMELRNCQREGSAIESVFSRARLKHLGGA